MIIRPFEASDEIQLLKLAESIRDSLLRPAFFNWPDEVFKKELSLAQTLVGEDEGRILGFVCYRELPDNLEITVLGTLASEQKQGRQSELLQALQGLAAKQRRSVLLEVHSENQAALGLYQKFGFHLLNTRKNYYTDGGSALVLEWTPNKAGC